MEHYLKYNEQDIDTLRRSIEDKLTVWLDNLKSSVSEPFEYCEEVTKLFRVYNKLVVNHTLKDMVELPILFIDLDEWEVDTSFVDEDQVLFTCDFNQELLFRVSHYSQYKMVDDDVIVVGFDIQDNFKPYLAIIEQSDWNTINEYVQENRSTEEV